MRTFNIFLDKTDAYTYQIALSPTECGSCAVSRNIYTSEAAFVCDLRDCLRFTTPSVERLLSDIKRFGTLTHFCLSEEVAAYLGWKN